MSVTIREGSILDSTADVIVNPANGFLRHGGGLARVIDKAAQDVHYGCEDTWLLRNPMFSNPADVEGNAKRAERYVRVADYIDANKAAPLLATGEAYATPAGLLPYKAIIHAVGPVYRDGSYLESNLLSSAHLRALALALERGWTSIAFPAISCGRVANDLTLDVPVADEQSAITIAKIEFERVTGQCADDEGCNCCGPPFDFRCWGTSA